MRRKSKRQGAVGLLETREPTKLKKLASCFSLLIFTASVLILSQLLASLPFYFFNLPSALAQTLYAALSYILAAFAIIYFGTKIFKTKPTRESLGLTGLPTWIDVFLAPVAFIGYVIFAALLAYVFTLIFPWFDLNQAQDVGYSFLYSPIDKLLAFIALCLLAPIFEELVFRGWLYDRLRSFLSPIISTLLVSLLFALLHGQWNVAVNVFAMSLVLCALREITGTIYAGILLHIIKNTVAFLLIYVFMFT